VRNWDGSEKISDSRREIAELDFGVTGMARTTTTDAGQSEMVVMFLKNREIEVATLTGKK